MATKPGIPKGTRDFFFAREMAKRNYIFDTIRGVYALYGFQQIETPAMENLSTLMGKYGEEGDKLLFKILNSGNFLSGIAPEELGEANTNKLAARLCEKGLRYDLTVPFARYVVQHRDELTMPFKRYQIQPVWRADRPQKGVTGVLPMRCRRGGQRFFAERSGTDAASGYGIHPIRYTGVHQIEQPQDSDGYCRDDRSGGQDCGHHRGHRQIGQDRA